MANIDTYQTHSSVLFLAPHTHLPAPNTPTLRRTSMSAEPLASGPPPGPRPATPPPVHWFFWRRVSLRRKRRARQHMKTVAYHTLNTLDVTLGLAGGAAGDAGIPGLSSALSALREIVQKILAMRTNVEGVDALDVNVGSLKAVVEEFAKRRSDQGLSEDTREQIKELSRTWSAIAHKAQDIKTRGRVRRFFTSNTDAKKLGGLVEEITASIHQKFLLQGMLNIKEDMHILRQDATVIREDVEVVLEDVEGIREDVGVVLQDSEVIREDVEAIREDVEAICDEMNTISGDVGVVLEDVEVIRSDVELVAEGVEAVREDVGVIHEDLEIVHEGIGGVHQDVKTILENSFMTAYAKNAQYDAGRGVRRPCLEGTRVGVLDRLRSWIIAACTRRDAILGAGSVFWICGLAGTGKTTIAYSITEWCEKKKILAANFFCSHSDAECSNPNLIFTTISRQLCRFHAPFKEKVAAVLRDNPDIVHAGPARQFEELIVRPLEAVKDSFPMSVIVLDALDECQDKETTSVILGAIAKFIPRIAGLVLFVVTSRPERRITMLFEAAAEDTLKDVTTPLLLHKIELESVLNDIRRFFEDGLRRPSRFFAVDKGWPAAQDLNRLVEMSGGLFIWAATALLFIMDQAFCDPEGQLQSLLIAHSTPRQGGTILDSLYGEIANAAFSKVSPTLTNRVRPILGAIATAQEPLSVTTLAALVELPDNAVRNALVGLGSVLHIPSNSTETIHVVHLTFPEFLLTPSPGKPEAFCITAADHHSTLFSRCMTIMRGLRRNIASIASPSTFKSEIPGLAKAVEGLITPQLSYACRYWITHLSNCVGSPLVDNTYDLFHHFLHHHFLHWLEACSLLEVLEGAVNAFHTLLRACQALGRRFAELKPLVADYWRFMLTYAVCIETAPLQVYYSALSLAPANSLVKKAYARELDGPLVIYSGASREWAPCLDAFRVRDGDEAAYAVAFSPSGEYFVIGSEESQLQMWSTATRTMVLSFDGPRAGVLCAAFSPDGLHIASGLRDGTIRIWQVSSGDNIRTLEPDPAAGETSALAFSADGLRMISADQGGEVRLWDMSNGRCILTLRRMSYLRQRPPCNPWRAAMSPDGGLIAYGARASLCLYDVPTATGETLPFTDQTDPGNVEACAFSPDGLLVAAVSKRILRIWRCADKALVRTINMPDDLSSRPAFSPSGTHISCGSERGDVYLLQVTSKDPPYILPGHTDTVMDVSWSPDSLQVISVSVDGSVRVWDVARSLKHAKRPTASQSQPAATGSSLFALAHREDSSRVVLLHLPPRSVSIDVADFATAASMPAGAPTLVPFADMVAAWNATLPGLDYHRLRKITFNRAWVIITGQQGVHFASQPQAVAIGSLMAYRTNVPRSRVVEICDPRDGTVTASLSGHTDSVWSVIFSPDGTLLATGAIDGSVRVWNPATGDIVCTYKGHTSCVEGVAFSPDGRLIVSGELRGAVHVFEAATGRVKQVFKHNNVVTAVSFGADDNHVLAQFGVAEIILWDVVTGTTLATISLDSCPFSLDLSPDGTSVLFRGKDSKFHPLPPCNPWPDFAVSKEGWVYGRSPGRAARLCWLPPDWRMLLSWDGTRFCCRDGERKRAIGFDVSQIPEYVQTWGSSSTRRNSK